jgi:NAD(P)-dependent dehydrogenase (short-subunit alcohol dehydrogenase family)
MSNTLPAVVITGTSTGIGRATALLLDRGGFRVFAGVRREADGESLRAEASEQLSTLLLDVTDAAAIELAAKTVAAEVGETGLAGLVNNAGIGVAGPIEFLESEDWRRQFEVNLFGPAEVIRLFSPLVRKAKGRIVNVSSAAGRASSPILGAYSASKFALEALSDALRVEVRGSGVSVSIVEPGFIETPMLDKGKSDSEDVIAKFPPAGRELYADAVRNFQSTVESFRKRASAPEDVARAIQRALTAERPKARYTVGIDSKLLTTLARVLPTRAQDAINGRLVGL